MFVSVHQLKKSVYYLETNIAKLALHDKNLLKFGVIFVLFFVIEENVFCVYL